MTKSILQTQYCWNYHLFNLPAVTLSDAAATTPMQKIKKPKIMAIFAIIMFIHTSEYTSKTITYTTNVSFSQYQPI